MIPCVEKTKDTYEVVVCAADRLLGAAVAIHTNHTERRAVETNEAANLGSNLKQPAVGKEAARLVQL